MESYYIVNPPITSDDDYYRNDDGIVDRVLKGTSMIAVGHRRSGKTSFLYKIRRYAKNGGLPTIFQDLGDLIRLRDVSEVNDIISTIQDTPKAIVLLDEAEVLDEWPNNLVKRLFKTIVGHNVVMSCCPSFVVDKDRIFDKDRAIKHYLDDFEYHFLGGLTDGEAEELISLKKKPGRCRFAKDKVRKILVEDERIPIVLQAICKSETLGIPVSTLLQNFGPTVLTGVTKEMKEILISCANKLVIREVSEKELDILMSIGLLKNCDMKVVLASEIVGKLIKAFTKDFSDGEETWRHLARILHLSDLHFGKHSSEPEKSSFRHFERLKAVILDENITPDFVVISGDLTWTGRPQEFETVEEFLNELVGLVSKIRKLSEGEVRKRFIIVPGNHEASWYLSIGLRKIPKRLVEIDTFEKERLGFFSVGPYANFINRFYDGWQFWDMEFPCMIIPFEEFSICFIALSTVHYITEEQKLGKFGSRVLERAAKKLEEEKVRECTFRIGVWHHNLRPDEGICIKDVEGACQVFAKYSPGIDLALHGHVHQGSCDSYTPLNGLRPIPYSSVGSFGVRAEDRPGDRLRGSVPNEFSIIDLETSKSRRRFSTQYYQLDLSIADREKWVWRKKGARNTIVI